MDKLLPLNKRLVTIAQSLLSLACSICLISMPDACAKTPTSDLASYNPYLKRLLETDHRYASIDLSNGACQVYVTLPLRTQGLPAIDLNLILGTFKPAPNQNTQDQVKEIRSQAKAQALDLLKGRAIENLELIDQFGLDLSAKSADKGPRAQRDAVIAAAQGDMQKALQSCQTGRSLNADSVETRSNLACLAFLAHRIQLLETEAISASVPDQSPVVSLERLKIALLTSILRSPDHKLDRETADALSSKLSTLRPSLSGRLALQAGLAQVDLLDLSQQKTAAFTEARKLAQVFGDNAAAHKRAGSLALDLKDSRLAKAYLERASSLAPGDTQTKNLLIRLNDSSGNLDEAIRIATQNVNAHPDSVEAHAVLGKLHLDNKEFLGARLQFERACEIATARPPDYMQESKIFAPYIRLLDIMNRFDEMVKVTQIWTRRFPDRSTCHYNLAYALDKASKTDKDRVEIIKQYKEAIRLKPDLKAAKYNLALILLKDGQNDQATILAQELDQSAVSPDDKQDAAYLKQILLKQN